VRNLARGKRSRSRRRRSPISREPRALVGVVAGGQLRGADQEGPQREWLSQDLAVARAARVVEVEQRRLLEGPDGAQAGRVGGVALHLGRAPLVAGHQDAGGQAVDRDRGGVGLGGARRDLHRLVHVRYELLVGRPAGGEAHHRRRAAQHLEEPAAAEVDQLSHLGRDLLGGDGRGAGELRQVAPELGQGGARVGTLAAGAVAGRGETGSVAHRWHVVQLVRVCTS
jgi:hypothetical protein